MSGNDVVITKHSQPVERLVPVASPSAQAYGPRAFEIVEHWLAAHGPCRTSKQIDAESTAERESWEHEITWPYSPGDKSERDGQVGCGWGLL